MDFKDYYKTLGVPRTATGQEIKKAYRKLARQYHPDANPGDNTAEDRIKEINEAYEVLSDEDKRSKYDKFGAQWQQYQRAGGAPDDFWQQWSAQPGARSTTRTVSPEEFEQMFGGRGGFSDFFESLFGGMRQPGGEPFADIGARASAQRRDIEQPLEISLEDAFRGTTVSLQKDGRRLEIKVPRGVKTGSRVRVAGEGAPASGNTPAGDLYLVITVLPHPAFERDGDDLRVKLPVDLYTLLLGGEVQAPTLERPVLLTIPPETPNGKVFRLRGLGLPQLRTPDQRGDLYATVEVQLPRGLSEDDRELFRQLRARSRAI